MLKGLQPTLDPSLPTGAFTLSLNKLSYLCVQKKKRKEKACNNSTEFYASGYLFVWTLIRH
jgi:hypothetical protein